MHIKHAMVLQGISMMDKLLSDFSLEVKLILKMA